MFKVTGMSVFVWRKLSIKQSSTTQLTATAENSFDLKAYFTPSSWYQTIPFRHLVPIKSLWIILMVDSKCDCIEPFVLWVTTTEYKLG